jgi:hypothetical protein
VLPNAAIFAWTSFSFDFLEEGHVLGVRCREAALDVVHAEGIQPLGHADLARDGKRDPFPLRPVAQGRVIDRNAFGCFHGLISPSPRTPNPEPRMDTDAH